jgi:hypothetical protein
VRRHPSIVGPLRAAALAAVLVVVAAACGQAAKPVETAPPSAAPTTKAANPTTSAPPPPTFPLTGTEADPAALDHPVVVVKMDNSPDARPQAGINEADVVYELLVEGITRYALVFHSRAPEQVGPVRSGRSSDPPLLANLSRPLVAWSGGNPGVTAEILAAADAGFLVDAGQNAQEGQYWRDNSRRAPHNLYTSIAGLLANATPEGATAPLPLFQYRDAGEPAAGVEATGMLIDFGQRVRAEYVWDAERGGWDRFQVDENHPREESATRDGAGMQVAPQNVVIMFTEYGQSPSDARSPMAITSGSGEAIVLTAGRAVHGTWNRPTPLDPWQLLDDAGQPIELTPGRTWVAMPRAGSGVLPLDQATADQLLSLRR